MTPPPSQPARFPVSIKGVAVQHGNVLLLHNERDEWELGGGKLASGEDPADCLTREIFEETGWHVDVDAIVHSWLYRIRENVEVFVVIYGVHVRSTHPPQVSDEHDRIGLFAPADVPALPMPEPYKVAIAKWCTMLGLTDTPH
ncbi:NUDIX domain-containing protein [Glycomyces sp. A-F 0318]|uniref:NUDIX hydrolase n=1 Tax=Glycomyces amatae TaxID=2881355 RepID=UPI001E564A11|nr:NUDIX domain-containing protein [Glycomyces amatae]MCD0446261.1 NUDIX domain-containing protein [Glycomyces amatae]